MFFGVLWMLYVIRRTPLEQRNELGARPFATMSIWVGLAFWLLAAVIRWLDIVKPAFPLVLVFVGVLLLIQGFALRMLSRPKQ